MFLWRNKQNYLLIIINTLLICSTMDQGCLGKTCLTNSRLVDSSILGHWTSPTPITYFDLYLSHLMRLWYFSPSVNSFFKRACATIQWGLMFDFWSVYFHSSCVRTVKALSRLYGCAGSPEPLLVAFVISTIISFYIFMVIFTFFVSLNHHSSINENENKKTVAIQPDPVK